MKPTHSRGLVGLRRLARRLAYLLAVVFPWFRPTVGVGLVEGLLPAAASRRNRR